MNISAYLGGVVCSAVPIFIAASKRFRCLLSARVSMWCLGASCVANSAASELEL